MLRLDKVIKPWRDAATLSDHINLYGFWNETAFLTKSGDLGMVLSVAGRGLRKPRPRKPGICREAAGSGAQVFRPWLPRLPIPLQVKPAGDSIRPL